MRERPWLDVSALRPLEGLLLAAQQAWAERLCPVRCRVSCDTLTHLLVQDSRIVEPIEDEHGVALVVWTVAGRVVVRADRSVHPGVGVLECESPLAEKTLWFAI